MPSPRELSLQNGNVVDIKALNQRMCLSHPDLWKKLLTCTDMHTRRHTHKITDF